MIYSFLYVLAFCFALVLIQKLDVSISPMFSLLITASIATIYFNLINLHRLKTMYAECWNNKRQWVIVMTIVLVMWGTTMAGPGKIGASLFNFIYFAWLGMLGYIFLSIQNWQQHRIKLYFALCIFVLILINCFFKLRQSFNFDVIIGIVFAITGGTASFIYFKQSQVLVKNTHLSATQVLAVRFYLSILILALTLPTHSSLQYFTLNNFLSLILLAFLSLIIPLYFSQKALEKITSEQHAIINSLCPIITGVLQEIFFKDLKIEQMIIYSIYTLTIISFYIINKSLNKETK